MVARQSRRHQAAHTRGAEGSALGHDYFKGLARAARARKAFFEEIILSLGFRFLSKRDGPWPKGWTTNCSPYSSAVRLPHCNTRPRIASFFGDNGNRPFHRNVSARWRQSTSRRQRRQRRRRATPRCRVSVAFFGRPAAVAGGGADHRLVSVDGDWKRFRI